MKSNTRKGFTLIELLIVVVIIGILAAIAIPKFASTKEKAYVAAMKTDLRNLVTAEEGYFADNQVYTSGTTVINPSQNVTITGITLSANGYEAVATHSLVTQYTDCRVQVGTSVAGTNKDGVPFCQ
ncbi:MAG TPA: prepilin-type N-terminal cleavage/methylation domain-containing protein [Gemmatimonadaceae bacterium]|nr:prepilin-type N-terminal cleavage/methylation domain-containing protein [Gemmatimonadaceae bacterium]